MVDPVMHDDDRNEDEEATQDGIRPSQTASDNTIGQSPSSDASQRSAPSTSDFSILPVYFGRYELIEEIARGGMGVVFKARQQGLNRVVALKMILTGQLASEYEVQRFRSEAEAAGNLQHPNIVSIHEVGEFKGQHFFSMDYVSGKSLADLMHTEKLPLDTGVSYLHTLAQGVEYAHQQGILHRDLKPANVLIDQDGQPNITDFGVAKRLEADTNLTATGTLVGTPSYMPPEQADSSIADVGPASDVYSLGAILYEMITGRTPFRGDSAMDIVLQVLTAEPVSPLILNPKISRDLNTICMKCLQKDPRRRYTSAEALADDLGRFRRREPIHARPVKNWERVARWCRRNPAMAALSVGFAIALVAGFIGITWQWQRAESEKLAAQAENARAEANLEAARTAVDRSFTSISETTLLNAPGLQPLRRELLQTALEYYKQFINQRRDDPELQGELASTFYRIGRITERIGSITEALSAYESALGIQVPLLQENPSDVLKGQLALTRLAIGSVHADSGDPSKGLVHQQSACDVLRNLFEKNPDDSEIKRNLVRCQREMGSTLRILGMQSEALLTFQQALETAGDDDAELPTVDRYELAMVQTATASLLLVGGSPQNALDLQHQAVTILEELQNRDGNIHLAQKLADALNAIGTTHANQLGDLEQFPYRTSRRQDQIKLSLSFYQRSRKIFEHLVAANPSVTDYRSGLTSVLQNIAAHQVELDDREQALQSYQQILDVHSELVRDHPTVTRFQRSFALSLRNAAAIAVELGNIKQDQKFSAQGLDYGERSKRILEGIIQQHPENLEYRTLLAWTYEWISRAHDPLGNSNKTIEALDGAIAQQQLVLNKSTQYSRDRSYLGRFMGMKTRLLRKYGRLDEAVETALSRQELWKDVPSETYNTACDISLCVPLVGGDAIQLSEEDRARRERYENLAVDALKLAINAGFANWDHIRQDNDLEAIRKHAGYLELMDQNSQK